MTNPTNHPFITPWLPCAVYYDDLFIPATATILLHVWEGRLDDESAVVSIRLVAMEAEREARNNGN